MANISPTICSCGKLLDRQTIGAPAPGDFTLCLYCTKLFILNIHLHLLPVTDEEFNILPEDFKVVIEDVRKGIRSNRGIAFDNHKQSN